MLCATLAASQVVVALTPSPPSSPIAVDGQNDDDSDNLTNQEEAEVGTNSNIKDTDGDGLWDGNDAMPKEGAMAVPAAPRSRYAIIELGSGTPLGVNDTGEVLLVQSNSGSTTDVGTVWKNGILMNLGEGAKSSFRGPLLDGSVYYGAPSLTTSANAIVTRSRLLRWNDGTTNDAGTYAEDYNGPPIGFPRAPEPPFASIGSNDGQMRGQISAIWETWLEEAETHFKHNVHQQRFLDTGTAGFLVVPAFGWRNRAWSRLGHTSDTGAHSFSHGIMVWDTAYRSLENGPGVFKTYWVGSAYTVATSGILASPQSSGWSDSGGWWYVSDGSIGYAWEPSPRWSYLQQNQWGDKVGMFSASDHGPVSLGIIRANGSTSYSDDARNVRIVDISNSNTPGSPYLLIATESVAEIWSNHNGQFAKVEVGSGPPSSALQPTLVVGRTISNNLVVPQAESIWRNGRSVPLTELFGTAPTNYTDWGIRLVSPNSQFLVATATRATTSRPILLVPCDIAVDANRDGVIKFAGNFNDQSVAGKPTDKTEEAKPFRFWCNDDDDHDYGGDSKDVVPPAQADHSNNYIDNPRDLEDFARLWIDLKSLRKMISNGGNLKLGLKWKNTAGTSPKINLFRAEDEAVGGDGYLKDTDAAERQAGSTSQLRHHFITGAVSASTPLIFPSSFWDALTESNTTQHLLFEGAAEGKGQLVVTIHNSEGTEIGEGPGVWLDLMNVKRMYVRAKGMPEPMLDRPWDTPSVETHFIWYPNGFEFEKPRDEAKTALVFVHGIHPPFVGNDDAYVGNINVAETTFKRLWHAGFKGRFAFFKWPALNPADFQTLLSLLSLPGTPNPGVIQSDFNESEWRALQHGRSLYEFVARLPLDYERNLYAHSQGNAVVAAAFRHYAMPAKTWVMTQGAIPRGCFNSHIENDIANSSPDMWTAGGYKGWLEGQVPARVVNFHNALDQITGDVWLANHRFLKPTISDVGLTRHIYSYNGSQREVEAVVLGTFLPLGKRNVTDLDESMSMLAKTKTWSIGQGADTNGEIDDEVNLSVEFGFGNSHGSQWEGSLSQGALRYFIRLRDEIE